MFFKIDSRGLDFQAIAVLQDRLARTQISNDSNEELNLLLTSESP